jgi:hypothetical protein
MATVVEDREPRRRTFYPWHEWTDGRTWRAKKGEDFNIGLNGFQYLLHQKARTLGVKVKTGCPGGDVVEFRFEKADEGD